MTTKHKIIAIVLALLTLNFVICLKLPYIPDKKYITFVTYIFFPSFSVYLYYIIFRSKINLNNFTPPSSYKLINRIKYFSRKYIYGALFSALISIQLTFLPCYPTYLMANLLNLEKCKNISINKYGKSFRNLVKINLIISTSNREIEFVWPRERLKNNTQYNNNSECTIQRKEWFLGSYVTKYY